MVTIAVTPARSTNAEFPAIADASGNRQQQPSTILPKTELAQAHNPTRGQYSQLANVKPVPQNKNKQRTLSIGGVVLTIILLGGLGIFYFGYYNYFQRQSLLQANIASPDPSHKGTLAINDPLRDNSNGYFWHEGTDADGSCTFTGDTYQLQSLLSNHLHACWEAIDFNNFVFQVQLHIISGEFGGIIFRSDSIGSQYYYFRVNNSGSYGILVGKNNSATQSLASGTDTDSSFTSKLLITIAIVADGSTLTPYIDGMALPSITDSTYSQGYIGFAAEDEVNQTKVAFSNARLWTF